MTGHEPQDQAQPARDELKEALGESRRELGALAAEIYGQLAAGTRARWQYTRTGAAEYIAAGESWLDQALRGTFCAVPPVGLAALTAEIPQTLALTVPLALAALWRAGGDGEWLDRATARREERRAAEEERRRKRDDADGQEEPAGDDDQEEPAGDDDQEEPDEDQEGPTPAEFVAVVRDLLGPRGKGVHLVEIQARLQALYPARSWPLEEVHELADAAGVPRATTRSANRPGATTGIRARDLPPAPLAQEDPPGGVVGAGQRVNNNIDNTAEAEVVEDAAGAVRIVYPHGRTAAQPVHRA